MASASNVGSILQRLKPAEVDGSHRNARLVGDGVLARDVEVEVAMEKIGGRVNRFCCDIPRVLLGEWTMIVSRRFLLSIVSFYL